jgi:hypothetical protein
MKTYEPGSPKVAFGVAAAVVAAITLSLFVALPAELEMGAPNMLLAVLHHVAS